MVPVSELYDIVQRHIDEHGPKAAWIARRIGMSPQGLNTWKHRGVKLPDVKYLVALADLTGTPYLDVLSAALRDSRYLPEEVARDGAPIVTQPVHLAVAARRKTTRRKPPPRPERDHLK